jgi:hypothetical protein
MQKPPTTAKATTASRQMLVAPASTTQVTGTALPGKNLEVRCAQTSNAAVNGVLARMGAVSMRPLLPGLSTAQAQQLHSAAQAKLGPDAIDLSKAEVVQLAGTNAAAAARTLAATPGVLYADTGPRTLRRHRSVGGGGPERRDLGLGAGDRPPPCSRPPG